LGEANAYLSVLPYILHRGLGMLFDCPVCKGKISTYYAELRVCQDCKNIVDFSDLLRLLREFGVTEQNIGRIRSIIATPQLFAS
jgi:hypothetical protein